MSNSKPDLRQLGESVFAIVGPEGSTNFGILRGEDGSALLIDADIRRIDEIENVLKQVGCDRVRYLFNTHENFDHSSANFYFEKGGAVVIGSEGCLAALQEDGDEKFAELAGRSPELRERFSDLKMGLPQVSFGATGTIAVPGASVRLQYYGISHSRGDTVAFYERDEILFAGDLLYWQVHPVTIYGDISGWLKTLDLLIQRRFKRIVPGHGPIPADEKEGKEALRKLHGYLEDFYQHLLEARTGKTSGEDVKAYMTSGKYETLGKTYMVNRNTDFFLKGTGSLF